MMNWKSWDPSDRTEINEIQKDQGSVGRILLTFVADDDQREELFTTVCLTSAPMKQISGIA